MPSRICCICGTKTSKKWSNPSSYDDAFKHCFGVTMEEIVTGEQNSAVMLKLCTSCQSDVKRYRSVGKTNLSKFGSKKGKQGKAGHKSIGGQRVKSSPETYVEPPVVVPHGCSSVGVNTTVTGTEMRAMHSKVTELSELKDITPHKMLTGEQEKMFCDMTKHKFQEAKSRQLVDSHTIYARNSRGPPIKLQRISEVRVPSKDASSRTIRNRAKQHEEFERRNSCTGRNSKEDVAENLTIQRAAQIKRDRAGYLQACKAAKFVSHAKFSRKTVMQMRSMMPMTLFKKVKRMFLSELGQNLMGTEEELYSEMRQLEYEYEGATFIGDSPGNPKVCVVRVCDVKTVVKETCEELVKSGLIEPLANLADNELWLHVSGDKGGKSTKLVLQVLNGKNRQSIQSARLLAMFEGDKDSRHNVGIAFGPIFMALEEVAADIGSLHIQRPVFADMDQASGDADSDVDLGFKPLQPLNHNNKHISDKCEHCVSHSMSAEDLQPQESGNSSECYQVCKLTYGGDWEWIACIIGMQKATCKYFCPHCLVSSAALVPGQPHSPTEPSSVDNGSQTLRTLEQICEDNEKYIDETGCDKDKAKNYHNCIYRPLIRETGNVIDYVSVSPMHVSLGIGLKNVNIMEGLAVSLDAEVKNDDGQYSEVMKKRLERKNHMSEELVRIEREREDLVREKEESDALLVDLNRNRAANRDNISELKEDIARLKEEIKDNETERKQVDEILTGLVKGIENDKGPFLQDFHDVMDSLALKRVVYHSGALIGNDVRKTLRPENVVKFASVFEPREIITSEGPKVFSSADNVNKIMLLLNKFASCYELYHRNGPLCKHEVEKLAYHCADFGTWYPCAFPDSSLIRKFHLLTHEIPRQARHLLTVGMLIEQVTESIHPFMNKMDYMFIQTQDTLTRQKLMTRQFNLFARVQHLDR